MTLLSCILLLFLMASVVHGTEPGYDTSIDAHVQELYGSDPEMRVAAARALGQAPTASPEAVGALRYALRAQEADVRGEAAAAFGHLGIQDYSAAGILTSLMNDTAEDPMVRGNAAYALAMMEVGTTDDVLSELIRLAEEVRAEPLVSRAHAALKKHGNVSIAPLEYALASKQASWSFVLAALQNIGTQPAMDVFARIQASTAEKQTSLPPRRISSNSSTLTPGVDRHTVPTNPEPENDQ